MFNSFIKAVSQSLFGQAEQLEGQKDPQYLDPMAVYQEGQIHLFELNEMLLEKIIEFLTIPALASFRRTCKTSKQAVDNYLDHYLSSYGRLEKLQTVIESSGSYCFMPEEQTTLDRLGQDIRGKLKLYYFTKKMLVPADTQSFPVSEPMSFPHLGTHYIEREFVETLGREIVVLRSVCWLHFVLDLGFQAPGCYQVRLRTFVDSSVNWPSWERRADHKTDVSVFKVQRQGAGEEIRTKIVSDSFFPEHWRQIGEGSFNNSVLKHSQVIRDTTSPNWHFIEFEPFTIPEETEMVFEFKDIDNPWWKSGLKWDNVEVRRVVHFK